MNSGKDEKKAVLPQGQEYLFKLVKADDPEWLKAEVLFVLNLTVTTETQTPAIYNRQAHASLAQELQLQVYYLWMALLSMESMQKRTGMTKELLQDAQNLFNAYLAGRTVDDKVATKTSQVVATTAPGLVFELRHLYLNR